MTQNHPGPLDGTHVRVAVIGAGFAGLGTAIQLTRSNEYSFLVLERADDIGGTWRDNVYPGVACDIPSHLYSFSFAPKHDWRRHYAQGSEIQQYLRDCSLEPGVAERIRLNTSLHTAHWDAVQGRWELATNRGKLTASVLVLGTGRFGKSDIPEIPGLASFPGPICHSSRWNPSVRPGMRVAVVGSGASAIQIVPALVRQGSQVLNIQRSAPWIIPKGDHLYSEESRQRFGDDDNARAAHREQIFADADAGFKARVLGSVEQTALQQRALGHLRAQVRDPEMARKLTPSYEIGCKRVLLSDDFYLAVASGRATVHSGTIAQIDGRHLTLTEGTRTAADALVFATGFEASRPAIAGQVYGRNGLRLDEHWANGMTSYGSTAVSGFPNMFILGGPNGALGHNSALAVMEVQIQHLRSVLDFLRDGWKSVEVQASAEADFTRMIDQRAAQTVWLSPGCTSWYRHERTGRLSLVWPGTAQEYAQKYSHFDPTKFHVEDAPPGEPSLQLLRVL